MTSNMLEAHEHGVMSSVYSPDLRATVQACSCGARRHIATGGERGAWAPLEGYYSGRAAR